MSALGRAPMTHKEPTRAVADREHSEALARCMSQTDGGSQTHFETIGSRAVSAAAHYPRYEQPPRPTSTKCSISALALDVPVLPRALRGEEKPTPRKGLAGLTAKQMRSMAECKHARELQWKLNMNCSAAMMRR
mmetsp:Transcript_85964/g.224080  ORF Transcript_85964/g.224080 Transcript_85964/m.224080 type:complete len:134 (+) Transcript_85964:20-421(+)